MTAALAGRTALITGASSGLGATFARALAKGGARVALAARRIDLLKALEAELNADRAAALAVEMDVADEASTRAAYDRAERDLGPIDTIIANAGINAEGLAADMAIEDFDRIFAANVRGVFLTVREGARRMIARAEPRGRILIVSSVTATSISPGTAAYSASKAAVLHLGRMLAREWARYGINVNMILPGYIKTDINRDYFESEPGAKFVAKFPRRRLVEEEDLTPLVRYLCSTESGAVTGSAFTVDDGQTL
jgi:NAD(P)-dependent dehydrogenase (short-subunit alcohol dehydrogenase family)